MALPTNSASPARMWLARSIQLLWLGLLYGIPAGALRAALRLQPLPQARDFVPSYTADAMEFGVLAGLAGVLACLLLHGLLRKLVSEWTAALLSVLLVLGVPLAQLVLTVNRQLLPGAFELVSLVSNAGLALLGCLLLGFSVIGLLWWQDESWSSGKVRWASLALLAAVPIATHVWGHRSHRDEAPDVLVILLDVLRADHLGCYGYDRPTSPNIDALAADSVLFENVVSASSFTKTAVSSLFTSLSPHHHAVYTGGTHEDLDLRKTDALAAHLTTMAERFYDHGLNTVAWVQNGQLRGYFGFAQGFSTYHDQPGRAPAIAESFRDWLSEWQDRARYFAYIHMIDLHGPYNPPPPYLGKFAAEDELVPEMDSSSWREFKRKVYLREVTLDRDDIEVVKARYDEKLAYTDEWVGTILDDLRARGRYDDTIIVLTSDHGEGFWEHRFLFHSNTPYEELVHIPIIIKLPDSANAGRRVEELVGIVDLGPTLLDLAGAPVPNDVDGTSFRHLLESPLTVAPPGDGTTKIYHAAILKTYAIRTERWKLILQPDSDPMLFDLQADPAEKQECSATYPEVTARLMAEVETAKRARAEGHTADQIEIDPETIKELEALGY